MTGTPCPVLCLRLQGLVPPTAMLVRNYRSHRRLLDLPSKLFYGGSLQAAADPRSGAIAALLKTLATQPWNTHPCPCPPPHTSLCLSPPCACSCLPVTRACRL